MKKIYAFVLTAVLCGAFASCSEDEVNLIVSEKPDSTPEAVVPSSEFYIANEDWFGHDEGSVNVFKLNQSKDYEIVYRAYRAANKGEKFGTTTQFATVWGDKMFFMSKQGNRLVVADAKTLKKKVALEDIGGDGRCFVGVDDQLGYISHSNGVRQFHLSDLTLGEAVEGIGDQIGNLCYAEGYLFAVSAGKVYIVDVKTNKVVKGIEGSFASVVRSKDGSIWVAESKKFIKIDPVTLEQVDVPYPENIKVASSWGAWNAGTLCASTQKNVLYWTKGGGWLGGSKVIVKYDIDTQKANTSYYTLGLDGTNELSFYGASLRVDPLTDKLVLTVKRDGWGDNGSYNWVQIVDSNGKLEKNLVVKGGTNASASYSTPAKDNNYYWFPAIPFFQDANQPQILTNQILLAVNQTATVDLNKKIIDADNATTSIIKRVEFPQTNLVTYTFEKGILSVTSKGTTGHLQCKITAISNGKRVEKNVDIDIIQK